MLRVAVAIAMKDLKQRLRDRSAIVLAIVAPFALTFIFAQTLSGITGRIIADFTAGRMPNFDVSGFDAKRF